MLINGNHIAIPSKLDGLARHYEIANTSPTTTDLIPLRRDCATSNVNTRTLVDLIASGGAWHA